MDTYVARKTGLSNGKISGVNNVSLQTVSENPNQVFHQLVENNPLYQVAKDVMDKTEKK